MITLWLMGTVALGGQPPPPDFPEAPKAPTMNQPTGSEAPVPAPAEIVATEETAQQSGPLVVEAKVPCEVIVDNVKLTQLWVPGTASFDVVVGKHLMRLYVSGVPADVPVEVTPGKEFRVLVGRTGVTVSQAPLPAAGDIATVDVELRVVAGGAVQVRVDGNKHPVSGGDRLKLALPPGPHALSIRSSDGTVIWAAGTLSLVGGAPVVVMIAEGRVPEVSGPARYEPAGGG
jgi:hypothetical protein